MKKKGISLLLVLAMALSLVSTVMAEDTSAVKSVYTATRQKLSARMGTYSWGGADGAEDWDVFALARDGFSISKTYKDSIKSFTPTATTSISECARAILTLTACGEKVSDALLDGVTDRNRLGSNNEVIFALLALDSKNYTVPSGGMSRETLISMILASQQSDYGWGYSTYDKGNDLWAPPYMNMTDVDTTAMAITALAPYYSKNLKVEAAIDSALVWLRNQQFKDGTFGGWGSASVESTAQVIVALTTLGKDPTKWNGHDAVTAMCTMAVSGGGFLSTYTNEYDETSTAQGYYALVAYERFKAHKSALYDMTGGMNLLGNLSAYMPEISKVAEHAAVTVLPIVTGAVIDEAVPAIKEAISAVKEHNQAIATKLLTKVTVKPTEKQVVQPAVQERPVVASVQTGDAGIVLYGVLGISALLGMGYLGKKKD